MRYLNQKSGFVKIILIIVIALIIVGYFGLDVQEILASPVVQKNLTYAWDLAKNVWNNYLSNPATWVWEHVVGVLWDLFLQGVGNLSDNGGQIPVEEINIQ